MATGKRAGSRRAARPTPTLDRAVLAYAGGITLCVIAWGYLVYMAIDFGGSARTGNAGGWLLLILAAAGAAACLFIGLMLVVRLMGALAAGGSSGANQPGSPGGAGRQDGPSHSAESESLTGRPAPRPPGGRRAAR